MTWKVGQLIWSFIWLSVWYQMNAILWGLQVNVFSYYTLVDVFCTFGHHQLHQVFKILPIQNFVFLGGTLLSCTFSFFSKCDWLIKSSQIAGLTNNSYLAEGHEIRHCVQKHKSLGQHVLHVAKVTTEGFLN